MSKKTVNSLYNYLLGSRLIGVGSTAFCFLMRDNKTVLKIYYNSPNTAKLFGYYDVEKHFSDISRLNDEFIIGPKDILIRNNKVIGYTMDYVNANTLYKMRETIKLDDLYKSIINSEDTINKLTNNRFRFGDLHSKNVLLDNNLYFIDLDIGFFDDFKNKRTNNYLYSENDIYDFNYKDLIDCSVKAMFGIKSNYDIDFYDKSLSNAYHKLRQEGIKAYKDFLNELKESVKLTNPSVKELKSKRKKVLSAEKKIEYYNHL